METVKKYITVGSLILLFTCLNISAYFVGLANTPPGRIFTGAVHYPPDYYYYLSFIAQGGTRWFTNFQLFNAETTIPELIGWFYTLSGHILLPILRSPVITYQVLTVLGSLFYLTVSFLLIKKILPEHKSLQTLVFILFLTSSTMPQITRFSGHWYYYPLAAWYNFGDPLERLTNIPHHLLFEGSALLSFILALDWWKTHTHPWRTTIIMAIIGFILASNQPALWLEVVIVLGVMGIFTPKKNIVPSLLPGFVVGISGLPFVLYLKFFLYTMAPYNALVAWESGKNAGATFRDYVALNGLLVVTAILGLPLWARAITREKMLLTVMTALSLLLYFSPVGDRLQILSIRFLSVIPTLFYASVTGYAIWKLFERYRGLRIILTFITALLIAITVPLDMHLLSSRNGFFVPYNSWDYLPLDAYQTYQTATIISRPNDMFLIMYPYDASFVGLTGRRIYTSYSNPLWRVNYEEKQKNVDALFDSTVTDASKGEFLKESHIVYIIAYSWIPLPYSGLTTVYRNTMMTIYKVPAL